ncbi:aspartate kinase [Pueribacillus sp. YX66]|uniref:aspartate kinase n=1 Tax=Pueribacillus sp. YX66 TaxID=3229242 RepID=UPI00358D0A0F
MKVIIQKFGGTSLKDDVGRKQATKHIANAVSEEYKVVVVVSAMGRKGDPYATDSLLSLISSRSIALPKREIDLLMACGEVISAVVMSSLVKEHGLSTTVLTGVHAGILTNNDFGNARISEIKTERIVSALNDNDVVIIPGFQGVTSNHETTTLGRGGSDTSAAALGVALDAQFIDIFTDVEGVMTADPAIVNNARPLKTITYTEVCNLAYQGAKVIHPRAVEIAMPARVPIRIRSTFSPSNGTIVTDKIEERDKRNITDRIVTGITYVGNISQIKISEKKNSHRLQSEVFKAMAEQEISVDFINISPNGVSYTVSESVTEKAITAIKQLGYEPVVEAECAKVSAVGAGMTGVPGVTAKIVSALTNEGIQIMQSADSHTTIWVLVKQQDLNKAVNALHETFQLNRISN